MMGYGQAFVLGYLFFLVCRVKKGPVYPWSNGVIAWGCTAMFLNWLCTLG